MQYQGSLLLLDDRKARKLASRLNIKYTGTLGMLVKAKRTGKIKLLKPLIEKIHDTDFKISNKLIDALLREVDEL